MVAASLNSSLDAEMRTRCWAFLMLSVQTLRVVRRPWPRSFTFLEAHGIIFDVAVEMTVDILMRVPGGYTQRIASFHLTGLA
jgi:hypothetical protein